MGQLMTSGPRGSGDKAWTYVRSLPSTKPYIYLKLQSPSVHECVNLDVVPSKVMSNPSDPPNSYYTSDTFAPHPTILNAWKYLGRLDDRTTVVNSEKILPISFQHQIREHELVKEVVMFGIGKAFPGLFIVPVENLED